MQVTHAWRLGQLATTCLRSRRQATRVPTHGLHAALTLAATFDAKKPGGAGGEAPKKKKKMGVKDKETLEKARTYLPPGASLSEETEWHTRFKADYPALRLPPYKSASYDPLDVKSKRAALSTVLEWAWGEHTFKTGDECPYNFDV